MFKNILVAEDSDGFNIAVQAAFDNLQIGGTHVRYCDDALLKVKKALADGEPFDLLISDLSFIPDHRITELTSGKELIDAVRKIQPDIPVIVFSIEDSPFQIQSLFENQGIHGYVFKGRHSIVQLTEALKAVYDGDQYLSPEIRVQQKDHSLSEIEDYDVELLTELSKGMRVEEIAEKFSRQNRAPYSVSAIEKRINKLKVYFDANNSIHMISLAKDLRIIK